MIHANFLFFPVFLKSVGKALQCLGMVYAFLTFLAPTKPTTDKVCTWEGVQQPWGKKEKWLK